MKYNGYDGLKSLTVDGDERALVLRYAPSEVRDSYAALLVLDDRFSAILRTTREPLIGQMRLTWWHDALTALDHAAPPAEPVLQSLAKVVVPKVTGVELTILIEGWEALLDPILTPEAIHIHAEARGAALFQAMATLTQVEYPAVTAAGRGWALADLALHLTQEEARHEVRTLALRELDDALANPWPARCRAMGALAHLARMNLATNAHPPGHPARAARLLWHRLSGR